MAVNVKGGALEFDAVINMGNFEAQINRIQQQLQGLTGAAEKQATAIDKLVKKTTQAIAAYATFTTATNFVRDIVTVRGEFQQLEVAFNTMLGSKEKADQLLAEVTQFAATTPFELSEVAGATKQLLAFGIESEKINSTLRSLGDVSAGIGQPLGEIAYLFGTIKTQGVALTQDVRQFAQRGIPIYEELAKVLKVSTEEVGAFITAGKVGFPEIEQAFINMTAEGSKFGGLMAEQAKTLTGQISNLQDAWAQMLNEIGRANEGAFSGAISAATNLVENYQTVLDVLKVLVITYGSYKAAVISTTAMQAIATNVTKGYTIAETLRYRAMLLSEKAMKLLNKTMLANPAVAVATGITLLITTLAIFGKQATKAKDASELLADAQKKTADRYAEHEAKLRPYIEALKQGNLSEQQRVDIYNKLQQIDPKIVQGIDAKSLSYENLTKNVEAYLSSLRNQLALEANNEAITASIKEEQAIENRIKTTQARLNRLNEELGRARDKQDRGLIQFNIQDAQTNLKSLQQQLELQKQATTELGKQGAERTKQAATQESTQRRTVEVIQDEIKALKDQRDKVSATSAEYKKFTEQISKLEKELEAITGKNAAKTALKDAKDRNKELLDLLKDIDKAEEAARRSGLTKEETEVDRINARYDELAKRAQEFKNNAGLLQRIENARSEETGNERLRDSFEDYKRFVEDQQDVFTQFEDYKQEFGEQKARELTDYQTGEYTDVIEMLKVQLALVSRDMSLAGRLKKDFLSTALVEAEKDQQKRLTDQQVEDFKRVSKATVTFNIQRKKLEDQYQKDIVALRKNYSGDDLQEREQALKQSHDAEVEELENAAVRQSNIYKLLNQDVIRFTRQRIKEQIRALEQMLKADQGLTPVIKKDIEDRIKQLKSLLIDGPTLEQQDLANNIGKILPYVNAIEQGFRSIADSVRDTNAGLADTLDTLSDVLSIAQSGLSAAVDALSGNFSGAIANAFSYYQKIFDFVFSAPKRTREEAQRELEEFNRRMLMAEQEMNLLLRERTREQVKLNKLKLDGLRAERNLLDEQKKLNELQFQQVLKQLQAESAVVGKTTEKYGGILGIGKKTRTVDIVESLAGRSFEELEQLFLKGQLEGKAKELFELLQRIKQEGADIDTILAENAEAAKEAFTGTTADSITDSIIEGFRNGMRSARDFADNFEQLMKNAVLQSIKLQALEGPLNDFFDEFAEASESDSILTQSEIDQLNAKFSSIIENAGRRFEDLQRITNLDFSSDGSTGSSKSLTGAIRGITEQQAELLAGQFGGLRLTALDQLKVASTQLTALQAIQNHTSNLLPMYQLWQRIELNGIKMK